MVTWKCDVMHASFAYIQAFSFDNGNLATDCVVQRPVCLPVSEYERCVRMQNKQAEPCIPHRHICKYAYPVFKLNL